MEHSLVRRWLATEDLGDVLRQFGPQVVNAFVAELVALTHLFVLEVGICAAHYIRMGAVAQSQKQTSAFPCPELARVGDFAALPFRKPSVKSGLRKEKRTDMIRVLFAFAIGSSEAC